MVYRVNVVLDEGAWLALQELPRGERSKLISQAVKAIAESRRRLQAAHKMDQLRAKLPPVSTDDLVSWIRADRKR